MDRHSHVISSQIDGLALRRQKSISKRHAVCDGKTDGELIEDVCKTNTKALWKIDPNDWERIFGSKE